MVRIVFDQSSNDLSFVWLLSQQKTFTAKFILTFEEFNDKKNCYNGLPILNQYQFSNGMRTCVRCT